MSADSNFLTASRFRNFRIRVENRDLFVNPHMLGNLSPVFEQMCLSDNYDEAKKGTATLNDEKFEDILDLFSAIMPTENNVRLLPVNAENAASLLRLADKFDVAPLLHAVDAFLGEADLATNAVDELAAFLAAIVKHNFSRKALRNATVFASMLPFKELLRLNETGELPAQVMPFCFQLNGAFSYMQPSTIKIADLRNFLAKLVKDCD